MNILVLSDYFSNKAFGGGGIVAFDEAKTLVAHGHKVIAVTTTEDRSEVGESDEDGVRVIRLYSNYNSKWRGYVSIYNPVVVRCIEEIMEQIKPDVIHAHNIHTHISYYCLKLAKKHGAKVFITMHDVMAVHYGKFTEFIDRKDLSVPKKFDYKINSWKHLRIFRWRYNPLRNIVIRHYLRYADAIFAVSGALKEVLNQNGIENVHVLYNAIDVANWKTTEFEVQRFKQKFGLVDRKIIYFSGWVTGAKGGDQILTAMKQILEKLPQAVLLSVGRTDLYYSDMKSKAQELVILPNIVFPGWLKGQDLTTSYFAADVVVFPSTCFDTFGMVNLEGMLSKKPLVSTCFGGAPEIVVDGVTGYIVNPFNVQMMAEKICELLLDTVKAQKFGQAGHERVLYNFDKVRKIKELESWYSSVTK